MKVVEFLKDFSEVGEWYDWDLPGVVLTIKSNFKVGDKWLVSDIQNQGNSKFTINAPTDSWNEELYKSDSMCPFYSFWDVDGDVFKVINENIDFYAGRKYVVDFPLI